MTVTLFIADSKKQDLIDRLSQFGINIICDINDLFTANGATNSYTWNPSALESASCYTPGSAEIISPSEAIDTLVARANADVNSSWTAYFGKDENGDALPGFTYNGLTDIHPSPYSFYAKSESEAGTFLSSIVTADLFTQQANPPSYTLPPPVVIPPSENVPPEKIAQPVICANTLAEIQASPIPPFNPIWGSNYPWGDRVRWALDHRANIYWLYVWYLEREPCASEVNWLLQRDNEINNIRYHILISEEYRNKHK